jgi:hypothetical protein
MTAALRHLFAETRKTVAADETLRAFVGDRLPATCPMLAVAPKALPVMALVAGEIWTDPLALAVQKAAPDLVWQQSFTREDGFSADYLNRYGWFNLVSPEGVFRSDEIRVSVGYWGSGLQYREHWHEPEEIYLVLAGAARFHAEGRGARDAKPGDKIHHLSNQKHAIDMEPGPLLAMAFWIGGGLLAKSGLS